MTDASQAIAAKPELTQVEAQLFVADIKASCAFFTSKLGFEVAFTYGEPPFYGQVKRDNARLNLRLVCGSRCSWATSASASSFSRHR